MPRPDQATLIVDYSGDLEDPHDPLEDTEMSLGHEDWSSEPIFGLGSKLGLDDGFYGVPGSNFGQYYYSRRVDGFALCIFLTPGTPGPLEVEGGEGHSTTWLLCDRV